MKTHFSSRFFGVLILLATVAVYLNLPPTRTAQASGGGEAAGSDQPLVKVEPVVVNLNDDDEVHYLKSSLELEVGDSKDAALLAGKTAVIRHELILLFSSLRSADLRGEKSKLDLVHKAEQRLNRALGKEAIRHIYFTELVVQ